MAIAVDIVFGQMEPLVEDVLSYLIVYQNTIQATFEFRIATLQGDDPFIAMLSASAIRSSDAEQELPEFIRRTRTWNDDEAVSYGLSPQKMDHLILLSHTRFSDNYYQIGGADCTVIALGGWEDQFAPPSIVEYYLSFVASACIDRRRPYD